MFFRTLAVIKTITAHFCYVKDIESNRKYLFENVSESARTGSLNEPFGLHELRRALREIKKHSAPGADRISYEMLQKLPKCSIKAVIKL